MRSLAGRSPPGPRFQRESRGVSQPYADTAAREKSGLPLSLQVSHNAKDALARKDSVLTLRPVASHDPAAGGPANDSVHRQAPCSFAPEPHDIPYPGRAMCHRDHVTVPNPRRHAPAASQHPNRDATGGELFYQSPQLRSVEGQADEGRVARLSRHGAQTERSPAPARSSRGLDCEKREPSPRIT